MDNSNSLDEVFDKIGKLLEENGISNAVVLLQSQPETGEPERRMFLRGDFYSSVQMIATAAQTVKRKMSEDLRGL